MKNIVLILLIFISLSSYSQFTDEIDLVTSSKNVINNKAANGTACSAEVIDECGTTFNTSNYGESNAGNDKGWKSMGSDWYNDLDNNSTTGTFNSASYAGISGGLADVAYSVENDIFYTFCPTSTGNWDITIAPSNCVSSTGGATTNGFQYAIFEGPNCGNFGNGLMAGGVNGQNHTTTQTTTINVTNTSNCIFIQIDGYAGVQCDFAVSVTRTIPCVLPIELEIFEGNNINGVNKLYWVTATEINNDYFTIERSRDGEFWKEIGTVEGGGNTNTPSMYELYDNTYIDGINYYRLTQTDFDGKSETFNIISINTGSEVVWQKFKIINLLGQEVSLEYTGIRVILFENGRSMLIPSGMRNPKIAR